MKEKLKDFRTELSQKLTIQRNMAIQFANKVYGANSTKPLLVAGADY